MGVSRFSVGPSSQTAASVTVFGFLEADRSGTVGLGAQADVSLTRPASPALDESMRAFTLTGHVVLGDRWFLAPGLGLQHRRWSGAERVESSDTGLALSVEAGTRVPLRSGWVARPSLSVHTSSIELEGSVSVSFVQVRLALSPR